MGRNEPYRAPRRSSVIPEPYPVQWVTETRGLNDIDRELLAIQEGRELRRVKREETIDHIFAQERLQDADLIKAPARWAARFTGR